MAVANAGGGKNWSTIAPCFVGNNTGLNGQFVYLTPAQLVAMLPPLGVTPVPISLGGLGQVTSSPGGTLFVFSGGTITTTAQGTSGRFLQMMSGSPAFAGYSLPSASGALNKYLGSTSPTVAAATTTTYVDNATQYDVLYVASPNTLGRIPTVPNALLITNSSGVISYLSGFTNGQTFRREGIGLSIVPVSFANGFGTSVTAAPGAVTVDMIGAGLDTVIVTGTTQTIAVNTCYIVNSASLVTFTLPASLAVGTQVQIIGLGAGGWKIAQLSGQSIKNNTATTTTGIGGSLSSSAASDNVTLRTIVANTTLETMYSTGTLTAV